MWARRSGSRNWIGSWPCPTEQTRPVGFATQGAPCPYPRAMHSAPEANHSALEANPEEAALVRKARWGDHDAFAQLYRAHAKAIHALAYRLTGNAAAAEDITQDTFLKMLGF